MGDISLSYSEKLAALEHATVKERLEIYKKARKLIENGDQHFMCFALEVVVFGEINTDPTPFHLFPELLARKPEDVIDPKSSWFTPNYFGRMARLALLDDIIKELKTLID